MLPIPPISQPMTRRTSLFLRLVAAVFAIVLFAPLLYAVRAEWPPNWYVYGPMLAAFLLCAFVVILGRLPFFK